jgi:hypothetical protein
LDEKAIVATLGQPCDVRTAEYTRTASAMAILDAFDRNIGRDEAIVVFQCAVELNERMREAELLARVIWDVDNGKYKFDPPEKLESYKVVMKSRLAQAETVRLQLLTQMKRVAECPHAEDIIN